MATLNEIALQYATKQPKQIDYITENAPIFNSIPYYPSSHGLRHMYEKLESITGGNFVDMDAPLPTVESNSKVDWAELSILGGEIEVGEDKAAQFGGASKYIAKKMPKIYKQTAMDAESQFIYNLLTPFAKKNQKLVTSDASPTGENFYSIMVVRWLEEEMCGLYDKNGFAKGTLFDFEAYNGGKLYKNKNDVPVYGGRFKS